MLYINLIWNTVVVWKHILRATVSWVEC